ncbi:hypothetical protein AB0H71_15410 [Nocardia sp. NPDC050697]|uniref:hypothetical protein n=1 Tax=Nocardia sp. NPDC050697 TaxID=3155158 RepID=UPI0033D96DAE
MSDAFEILAGEATEGRLRITDGVAAACAAECDRHVQVLVDLQRRTADLVNVEAFGTLNSATILGDKFRKLAMGGDGSGSFREALQRHIETVQSMADMFRKAGAAYAATEQDNTANLGRST